MFGGTERFFRPGYRAHLVSEWLPALDGAVPKLEAGATVADIGCGHGASTLIMAQAYPASRGSTMWEGRNSTSAILEPPSPARKAEEAG